MESTQRALLAIVAWYFIINIILWTVFGVLKSKAKKNIYMDQSQELMKSANRTKTAAIVCTVTPAVLFALLFVDGAIGNP
jgi:hypothetical protein